MNHAKLTTGVAVVSIDLRPSPRGSTTEVRSVLMAVDQVLAACRAHRLAATWCLGEPLSEAVVERLRATGAEQELALSIEALSRGGVGCGREVDRRLAAALRQGWEPTTVALEGPPPEGIELLNKLGIRALRLSTGEIGGASPRHWGAWQADATLGRPRMMRWGVWGLPITTRLDRDGARAAKTAVDVAARQRSYVQVAINALVSVTERGGVREIERLLDRLTLARDQGQLRLATLGGLAADLSQPREAVRPAVSILRRRAA